jgi:N-acetylglutamate synthase-like GNAT family acetyltransferase
MLRKATVEDLAVIVSMKLRMFDEAGYADLLKENAAEQIQKKYNEMYGASTASHFVIEDNGTIVACAGAFLKDDIPYCFYKTEHYGFIGDVYVSPQFRKRGYARSLTQAVIEWLEGKGIHTIRLLATPEARHMYHQLGFVQTDEMVLHLSNMPPSPDLEEEL